MVVNDKIILKKEICHSFKKLSAHDVWDDNFKNMDNDIKSTSLTKVDVGKFVRAETPLIHSYIS